MKFISNKSRNGGTKKFGGLREGGKTTNLLHSLSLFFETFFGASLFVPLFSLPLGEIISVEASLLEGREGGGRRQMPPPVLPSHTSGKTRDSSRIRQQNFYIHTYFYSALNKCFIFLFNFLWGNPIFVVEFRAHPRTFRSAEMPFAAVRVCSGVEEIFFVSFPLTCVAASINRGRKTDGRTKRTADFPEEVKKRYFRFIFNRANRTNSSLTWGKSIPAEKEKIKEKKTFCPFLMWETRYVPKTSLEK